jgi:hypothetical protein
MKKIIISLITVIILLFPAFTQAGFTHAQIQKDMILARHDVTLSYGHNVNVKLDKLFSRKIINNDNSLFESLRTSMSLYFKKRGNSQKLSKKEKLYKYLLIRSYYELTFRKK